MKLSMVGEDFFQVNQMKPEKKNIKEILWRYLRYWYLFVIGGVLFFSIAFLYLQYFAVPKYKISSILLIKEMEDGTSMSGAETFSNLGIFTSTRKIENEIGILKSNSLMQRVLSDLSLRVRYYSKGKVKDKEVYGENLPLKILIKESDSLIYGVPVILNVKDKNSFELNEIGANGKENVSVHQFGQEIHKPYGTFTVVANSSISSLQNQEPIIFLFQDIQELADQYGEVLSVSLASEKGSLLNISLIDPIPNRGRDIVNKLIEFYNQEAIDDKNQLAVNTIELIDERMKYLTTELTDVEKNVERYKQQNDLTNVSSEAELYLERASEYNRQLAEFEIQIDVLNSIESYLKKQGNEIEMVPSSLNIQDPTLLALISKFNELQLERRRMLRTTQKNNPLVVDLDEQLYNLRVNILENLRNIKEGLIITQKNVQASSSKFEKQIQKVPSVERELLEISRQQSIKEGLYLYLLQEREEAALSLVAAVANSRVVDPARAGKYPVSPNNPIIYLAALMLGLGLPFAAVFIKETLNDKVEDLKEVKQATATPILGEISHNYLKDTLVVTERGRSATAELFRLIRTNLQFSTAGKENKVILITSSMSGEGKTFFSLNLGATLAITGKRVVVVNFDLRKPNEMQKLGVTNYLINVSLSVEEIAVPSPDVPGLFLIGSGPLPPNPAELIMSIRVNKLIDELKEKFDYVLIDTSPAGQVADPFSLSSLVDSSIFLVRYGYTKKGQLEIIDDIYQNKKLTYPMIVLNDAKKENGYGYGYGYGGELKKNGIFSKV